VWVFAAAAAYWAASLATSPAWNTWIEEIIPKRLRANFFACRARISQIFTLIGFATGGLALHWGRASDAAAGLAHHWELTAFVGIFVVGAACRYLSGMFLSQQTEPSVGRYQSRPVSPWQLVSQTSGDVGGKLVLYLLAMQTAVQISGPYFTPFMLAKDKQNLSYLTYMLLIGVCFLGKAIALPLWGRLAHYAGARRLLWIGGTAIVPIAALWVLIDVMNFWQTTLHLNLGFTQVDVPIASQFIYIALVQLVSGVVWAAYELAMLLMFFEAIPKQDRTGVLTFYNFGNAAALVLGSLIGAAILQACGEAYWGYLVLFGLSSVARFCTLPLLLRTPDRHVAIVQSPALRVIAVRPDDGSVDRPILPSLADGPEE
jgi:MFS family permease